MSENRMIRNRFRFSDQLILYINQHILLLISIAVSLFVGILYLSIAPTRLTDANFGSDGGDFLAAILTRGIPHPTGYPIYVLLGMLFQAIPISTNVFRGVLESAIPAATAAGLLTAWVGYALGASSPINMAAAAVSGLAWGIAPLLFSQAVIVEVHGLQAFFVVVMLWWVVLNLNIDPGVEKKWIFGVSLLVGLGLGNHVTILLFLPVAVITLILAFRRTRLWKFIFSEIILLLGGMMVYLYLPLAARNFPPINWGNPQTWPGFLWLVTGAPYQGMVFNVPGATMWDRTSSIARLMMDQFGAVALVIGVIGAVHISFPNKWLRWILVWTFVIYFVFAIGYNTQDSAGYLIPAIMVFAIWIGVSIPALRPVSWKRLPVGTGLICILIISTVWRIPATRSIVDPRQQDQPAQFAEKIMQEAPVNAIIETGTDQDTFPLWYYHFGLEQRPDLRIVVISLSQFVWYQETLIHTYPDLNFPAPYTKDQPNADWGRQIKALNPERPVCTTKLSTGSESGVAYICSP